MGSKILVVFKVFPEGPDEVSLVEKGLRGLRQGEFKDLKKEPLAFGLEVIKVAYVIPDKTDGAMEALEGAVKGVKGVNQVEVEAVTLL